jgi:hypothetical protein
MKPIDAAMKILKQQNCNGYADEMTTTGNPNPRRGEPQGDDLCGHPGCSLCGSLR